MLTSFIRATCVLALLVLVSPVRGQDATRHDIPPIANTISLPTNLPLPPKGEANFIVSVARDGRGDLWLGTEDKGVWRFDGTTSKWINYRIKDGLGDDNVYAITVDLLGRVWVGHLNHGVSVWNGKAWRNYNVLQGPLGERVFALATSPIGGDVWMATNAGLSCYSSKNDKWTYFTEANGLPTHEISALAFDSVGTLYIGTQCDGLLIGKPDEEFKNWQQIKGPDALPTTAFGSGLPSNLINDVLVADDDTIYVATTCGLARSKDFGEHWTFIRGGDWLDKLHGLYSKSDGKLPDGALSGELLREDYVTGLAEDPTGLLWISYRRRGYEIRRPLTDRVAYASAPQNPNDKFSFPYASTLLTVGDFKALVGTYSDGLIFASDVPQFIPTKEEQAAYNARRGWRLEVLTNNLSTATPRFPSPAQAPSLNELNTQLASLGKIEPMVPNAAVVAALPEDWTTQGDWLGRYGRYWASLNAMVSPKNYLWGAGWTPIDHAFQISPKQKNDTLRYWIQWQYTDNRRSLEIPPIYLDSRLQKGLTDEDRYRRQAEIDDHGETYPLTHEGPNIYFSVKIPPGLWTLSFYNHNKDGHTWLNRMRDYRYSIRPRNTGRAIDDVRDFDTQAELVHSRQRDFWGGVYKRYLVRGPQQLTVEISKNNSLNTILAGAFLDLADEQPAPYFRTLEGWQKRQTFYDQEQDELREQSAEKRAARFVAGADEKDAANRLFIEIERLRRSNPSAWAIQSRPIYELLSRWLRPAIKQGTTFEIGILLAHQSTCFYYLSCYNEWESIQRRRGLTPARDIEKSLKWDGQTSASGREYALLMLLSGGNPLQKFAH